ncbi:MAG: hypothetical protein WC366_04790 [Bacilli bacterium]|jgi:hypothetical protein
MNKIMLTDQEMSSIVVGEAITLGTVMAIIAIAIAAVVIYKLFTSDKGSSAFPGGYRFEWK